jgi:hypothetical protein
MGADHVDTPGHDLAPWSKLREMTMDEPENTRSPSEDRLSTKDKISVLMGEYSSLRSEIHHRLTLLLTFTGTGITCNCIGRSHHRPAKLGRPLFFVASRDWSVRRLCRSHGF